MYDRIEFIVRQSYPALLNIPEASWEFRNFNSSIFLFFFKISWGLWHMLRKLCLRQNMMYSKHFVLLFWSSHENCQCVFWDGSHIPFSDWTLIYLFIVDDCLSKEIHYSSIVIKHSTVRKQLRRPCGSQRHQSPRRRLHLLHWTGLKRHETGRYVDRHWPR